MDQFLLFRFTFFYLYLQMGSLLGESGNIMTGVRADRDKIIVCVSSSLLQSLSCPATSQSISLGNKRKNQRLYDEVRRRKRYYWQHQKTSHRGQTNNLCRSHATISSILATFVLSSQNTKELIFCISFFCVLFTFSSLSFPLQTKVAYLVISRLDSSAFSRSSFFYRLPFEIINYVCEYYCSWDKLTTTMITLLACFPPLIIQKLCEGKKLQLTLLLNCSKNLGAPDFFLQPPGGTWGKKFITPRIRTTNLYIAS